MATDSRPGQLQPTDIEVAVLRRIATRDPSIHGHLDSLHVLSREFTGVGSFTRFLVDDSMRGGRVRNVNLGSSIRVPGVPNGLGAVLFCVGDHPECLELFNYGNEHWDGTHEGFSIDETA